MKALRRVRRLIGKLVSPSPSTPGGPEPRGSSLPFISGDTFRAIAEICIEGEAITVRSGLNTGVVFADAETSCAANFHRTLSRVVEEHPDGNLHTLIIHNGDHVPHADQFTEIREVIPRVFCKNVLDDVKGVTPIPIGLENVALKHNGKLHYYLDALEHPTPADERTRMVLSSFHESTNREIREPVRDLMRQSRHGHDEDFRKSLDYRLEVRRTKFVISPPGNGIDAHRTWEAIYLGAVPVVLNGYLADSLTSDLPIMVVESYEDFCELSDAELTRLYLDYREKPMNKAWGHYWLSRVLNESLS